MKSATAYAKQTGACLLNGNLDHTGLGLLLLLLSRTLGRGRAERLGYRPFQVFGSGRFHCHSFPLLHGSLRWSAILVSSTSV